MTSNGSPTLAIVRERKEGYISMIQRIAILATLLGILTWLSPQVSVAGDFQNEIFVRFVGDVAHVVSTGTSAPVDSSTIKSPEVLAILNRHQAQTIVKMFSDGDTARIWRQLADGQTIPEPNWFGIFKTSFPDSASAAAAVSDLKDASRVLFAQQNGLCYPQSNPPNDPLLVDQWALWNHGQYGLTVNADINAPEAWNIETGSSSLKIGLIGTGVKLDHPDLQGRVSGDWNQTLAHETAVAGVIGAITNNGEGIAGVNWNSPMLSKWVGNSFYDYQLIHDKTIALVNEGAKIINASYGGAGFSYIEMQAMCYAYNSNVLLIGAAGNDSSGTVFWPARHRTFIAVSSTNSDDELSPFSNWGTEIDVAAPGGQDTLAPWYENIVTTSVGGDGYASWLGTSFAVPHVTGVASLLKSHYPNLYNDDIAHIIYYGADDKGTPGWDSQFGWGRLDADSAFKLMKAPNVFAQYSASGGYNYSTSGYYQAVLYGFESPAAGSYVVKRHEVRKSVSFQFTYSDLPKAWGRGPASSGLPPESPIMPFKFCEVVPGTITGTGCELRSYVYEVWNILGQFLGWVPCQPSQVTFGYSVLGKFGCTSCGDANSDEEIDISDAVFIISYVFSGGAAPADCNYANGQGDANGDLSVDISDAYYLIAYIYSGGPAPHCYGL
jgi:subtilisin family serine protease